VKSVAKSLIPTLLRRRRTSSVRAYDNRNFSSNIRVEIHNICLFTEKIIIKASSQPPPEWLSRAGFSEGEGQALLEPLIIEVSLQISE